MTHTPAKTPSATLPVSGFVRVFGVLVLLVATGAMAMLVAQSLFSIGIFGCGTDDSPCAQAGRDAWGKVPGMDYPVSFVGGAFFLGMLIAWLMSPLGVSIGLVWLARLSALVSVAFLGRIFFAAIHCQYCLAAHVGNLLFWGTIEWAFARQRRNPATRPSHIAVGALVGVAALATAAMAPRYYALQEKARVEAAARAEEDVNRIIAQQQQPEGPTPIEDGADPTPPVAPDRPIADVDNGVDEQPPGANDGNNGEVEPAPPVTADSTDANTPNENQVASNSDDTSPVTDAPFTGRYRLGPDPARVRIVMFMDYQCKDCKRVEGEAMKLAEERDDVSLSVKHFPMSTDCNPNTVSNTHPNACWAARLAEAIGELHGNDAYWDVHRWLFAHGGSFTAQELGEGLRELGYEGGRARRIIKLMQDPRMEEIIKKDIDEGVSYGLYYTPMVFINGGEFRPGVADGALTSAVERILASNVPMRSAADDRPPPAMAKFISDYRGMGKRRLPEKDTKLAFGPDDASVEVTVWGEFFEKGSRESAALIREAIEAYPDTRFVYRYYPLNIDCNPAFARMADKTRTRYENSCLATRAVEAAGQLGGRDVYWKMHAWMCDNVDSLTLEAVKEAAVGFGLDEAAFEAAIDSPEVQAVIDADCEAGGKIGIKSIPTIFVDSRQVPRWKIEGQNALKEMIRVAHEQ
ncbi:MAG: thioredoxin domain-containing protein [Phycisphaerales bacterium]|nr:thioredoxin domain-containing protein [Phycisphaerales bacterium]